ncbi:hypothetical protein [Jiangella gansuensis]|nr:hypothetical protein [Jiangella gansuensis]
MAETALVINETSGALTWVCAENDPLDPGAICGRDIEHRPCPMHGTSN